MDLKVAFENDKLICLKQNHNEKIILFVTDNQVPFSDRFLCSKCTETHQSIYSKLMPINSAISIIKEKITKQNQQEEVLREKSLNTIKQFSQKMNDLQSKLMNLFNEIQRISLEWIANLENLKKQGNFFFEVMKEFQYLNQIEQKEYQQNNIHQNNKVFLTKLATLLKKLSDLSDYENQYSILKKKLFGENIFQIKEVNHQQQIKQQSSQSRREKVIQANPKMIVNSVELKQSFSQMGCYAMAFNQTGNIFVSGCQSNLKVWVFENEIQSEYQTLTGHSDTVFCIVFSQKSNWFVSGSKDNSIKCWRENNQSWICTNTASKHTNYVICLIMNKNENQLISCSWDTTIIVWKVDSYKLEYNYTLDKHTKQVCSISLNESETALVSCSFDQSIILWVKNQNYKWKYKHQITNNHIGFRICFIDNYTIIQQQRGQGITHFFSILNGQLQTKPELNLELDLETTDDFFLFPTIYNKQKQIIIQKHNQYIYIVKKQSNGKLQVTCQPIVEGDFQLFGTLSNDGQYLTTWSRVYCKLRVYQLEYK